MGKPKKKWKSAEAKRKWMASPKGVAWLEKQMEKKRARRKPVVPIERFTRTKYPFTAIINGVPKEITQLKEKR